MSILGRRANLVLMRDVEWAITPRRGLSLYTAPAASGHDLLAQVTEDNVNGDDGLRLLVWEPWLVNQPATTDAFIALLKAHWPWPREPMWLGEQAAFIKRLGELAEVVIGGEGRAFWYPILLPPQGDNP